MYPYAYLIWCLIFAVVWAVLYVVRKDSRREIVLLSIFCTPLGPLTQFLHLYDYWRPMTITGTALGIEDVLIAFFIGGITAGFYSFVKDPDHVRHVRDGIWAYLLVTYAIGTALMYGGFFLLGLSSVEVAVLALGLFGAVPIVMKPWVRKGAFLSSILFCLFLFGFEALYFQFFPGIVDAWWFGATWGRIWGVPYEELVWGFLWGLVGASGTELVARLRVPRYIP